MKSKFNLNPSVLYTVALFFGVLAGVANIEWVNIIARTASEIFINLLKLVSLPIIFLSIVSTASGMESLKEVRTLGRTVVKYTLLTTILAATIALSIFVAVNPVRGPIAAFSQSVESVPVDGSGYFGYLIKIVPSNILEPFVENHVIGVLFIAILFSMAIISLPNENRGTLHHFFSSLYAAVMKITTWVVKILPIGIWAFITLFVLDLQSGLDATNLALYLVCVIAANLIQAFIVLPLLLKKKGISPIKMARGMMPALSMAFFSKSSSAALPMAMKCAEDNVKISRKVSSFSLPLCTTINMNACAAFILITVLFVSMSYGVVFSPFEMVLWIFIATIAAVGNAGVPMGCYFIASAFLAAMNVPLNMLGIILPFYSLIDMLESAINVWSDSCVTAVVDQEIQGFVPATASVKQSSSSSVA